MNSFHVPNQRLSLFCPSTSLHSRLWRSLEAYLHTVVLSHLHFVHRIASPLRVRQEERCAQWGQDEDFFVRPASRREGDGWRCRSRQQMRALPYGAICWD